MDEKQRTLASPDFSDRGNVFFLIAKAIVLVGQRILVRPHLELHGEIALIKQKGDAVFLFAGLHKSLWETTGAAVCLHDAGLPLPYVGMGDNLIKGAFFQTLAKKIGAFLIKRPGNRREMIESARGLRQDVLGLVARGHDVMVFPEGTRKNVAIHGRYGDFFPAAFDALIEYERDKAAMATANPDFRPVDTYVVPLNVDYSRVREARELVGDRAAIPRTLHVTDSFSMLRSIGDTHISFGAPIRVADHLTLKRKGLASLCRERCLELVKILPVNVASRAMLELAVGAPLDTAALGAAVARIIADLRSHSDRFRGFTASDPPAEIVRRARQDQLGFARLAAEDVRLYRLYADYIGHYLSPAAASN